MPQVINENPRIGALFASGLGQGLNQSLGTGLQTLAQHRLNQMLYGYQGGPVASALGSLLGESEESQQPEQQFVLGKLPQIENELSQTSPTEERVSRQRQIPKTAEQLLSLLQSQGSSPFGINPQIQQSTSRLGGSSKDTEQNQVYNNIGQVKDMLQLEAYKKPEEGSLIRNIPELPESTVMKKKGFADYIKDPRLTPDQRFKLTELAIKEQDKIDKQELPRFKQIEDEARGSKEANNILDNMEEAIGTGNITQPGVLAFVNSMLELVGMPPLAAWGKTHSVNQEFQQLSNLFAKQAKEWFPGRVTDTDIKLFMKTIPTLLNSDAGKTALIRNLRQANNISILRQKAAEAVVKENGGRVPRDFSRQVDKRVEPLVNKIYADFKKLTKAQRGRENTESFKDMLEDSHFRIRALGLAIPKPKFLRKDYQVLQPGQSYNPVTKKVV